MNKPSGRLPNGIPQVPARRLPSPFDQYRSVLPITSSKDEIVKKIRDHQVVIICGEAGVGKTTQVHCRSSSVFRQNFALTESRPKA